MRGSDKHAVTLIGYYTFARLFKGSDSYGAYSALIPATLIERDKIAYINAAPWIAITMETERYERGFAALRRANKEGMDALIRSMDSIAPDLARYVIEFAYGDVYTRPGLSPKQRELCIVAALTALGNRERQLRDHIQAALNSGCTTQELTETVLMMTVYAGFPAAINGMQVAREVLFPDSSQR